MVAAVQARPGDRVLDVATGTGLVARALKRRYGCSVVGLDQSEEMLSRARPLVGPVYEPAMHGPQAGFSLLRACLETQRVADGEALLARLRPLATPPFVRQLDEFQRAFDRLHAAAPAAEQTAARA